MDAVIRARTTGAHRPRALYCGSYVLYRQLVAAGIESMVVTPQRLDTDGRSQKTVRLDARALAKRFSLDPAGFIAGR